MKLCHRKILQLEEDQLNLLQKYDYGQINFKSYKNEIKKNNKTIVNFSYKHTKQLLIQIYVINIYLMKILMVKNKIIKKYK